MKYEAQVPLRIDFGGGWTDVPTFCENEPGGGAVLNAAIDVYAKGYVVRPYSDRVPVTENVAELQGYSVDSESASDEKNIIHYELDVPAGAGLGGSAAQTLLWLTLVKTSTANTSSRSELAEAAWRIENELGITGGRQDQYCCALGGINFMTFGKETQVEQLRPSLDVLDQLEPRLSIYFTGQSHLSGAIHDDVWRGYTAGGEPVREALHRMRDIAREQRDALMSGDLDKLGELMNENWACQKQLSPAVTTPIIDKLVSTALDSGALGVKATGAGGGGCILCLAEQGAAHGLAESMRDAGATIIPFRFDWYGVHLRKG